MLSDRRRANLCFTTLPLIFFNLIILSCDLFIHDRFQSCVHLETKTDATDVKTRYIVVSQVKSEAEFRNREERKRELETVS